MTKSVLLAALVLLAPGTVSAQSYAIEGVERFFRIESTAVPGPRGVVVSGYVYNTYGHTADRLRLVVEALDGAGQVIASTFIHIAGIVEPGGRAYFETVAPPAASHRVRVISYDPIGRGA